ncbi:MAG: lipopolysaccharide heptosyltransferase I, partial [Acidobacteriota bacterium]
MRILLVRTSAMGDVVHTLPVLMALRRSMPQAKIAWVVEAVWSRVLDGHPDIDQLIRVRTKAWRKTWKRG